MQQKIDWSAISPDESEKLKDELVEVWEASVRSTHHFLAEKDIQFFKPLVRNNIFRLSNYTPSGMSKTG